MSTIIPRVKYIDRIRPYIDKDIIKVLTGQRRVGKSYILKSIRKEIEARSYKKNIIWIDLEDFAFSHITDAKALHQEIQSRIDRECKNYLFIDEIQEIEGFEKVIRSLNSHENMDIYVTGSNSSMLSAEIGSRLAGRSIEINVHPLSYKEFILFHSRENCDDSIEEYLRYGGMPYLHNLPDRNTWTEYLAGLVDAIVYRDIVTRHSVRNNDFLQRLLLFLSNNIGNLFTAKSISDYLKSQRTGGTVNSVQTYIDYICQAYIINKARRWDIEGRKYFEIGEKYYFEDLGIRNSIVGYRPMDKGYLLENAVYNKLKEDGYEVKVGIMSKNREIDFIGEKRGERIYIQVALHVEEEKTALRELGNLIDIPDNYRKLLITLKDSMPNTFQGIQMLSLREFLSNDW